MSILTIPVGMPGSGKSTYAANNFEPEQVVSPDHYREIMSGNRALQYDSREVFQICHLITEVRLKNNLDVCFDAMNLTVASRRKLIELARKFDAEIQCVWFNLSFEQCCVNNEQRTTPVSSDVMMRCYEASTLNTRKSFANEGIKNVTEITADEYEHEPD